MGFSLSTLQTHTQIFLFLYSPLSSLSHFISLSLLKPLLISRSSLIFSFPFSYSHTNNVLCFIHTPLRGYSKKVLAVVTSCSLTADQCYNQHHHNNCGQVNNNSWKNYRGAITKLGGNNNIM